MLICNLTLEHFVIKYVSKETSVSIISSWDYLLSYLKKEQTNRTACLLTCKNNSHMCNNSSSAHIRRVQQMKELCNCAFLSVRSSHLRFINNTAASKRSALDPSALKSMSLYISCKVQENLCQSFHKTFIFFLIKWGGSLHLIAWN